MNTPKDACPPSALPHGLKPMSGRRFHESHRTATPLELLYDLTLVVAFGVAGGQAAHLMVEGHIIAALIGFAFSMFAVCWCWIGYSWFASGYDTDDWGVRLLTLLQMLGVMVMAAGMPRLFHGLPEGHLDNGVLVAGYVLMRVSLIAFWLRAARDDGEKRTLALRMAALLLIAQAGWVAMAVAPLPLAGVVVSYFALFLLETVGTWWVAHRYGPTRWNAHHMAERFGLLAIITFGEGIIGTMAAIQAVAAEQGWTLDVGMIGIAGLTLTVGMWWVYFVVPNAQLLECRPRKLLGWSYGHMVLFAAIAGTGAGLHVAAYLVEGKSHLGLLGTVLAIAAPVTVYLLSVYALFVYLAPGKHALHAGLLSGSLIVTAIAVVMAAMGASLNACLLVLMLAPWVTVLGYEWRGHRDIDARVAEAIAEAAATPDSRMP